MNPGPSLLQWVVAMIVIVAFIAFLSALFLLQVPPENKDTLMLAAGVLFSGVNLVLGYFFGSSQGSKDKQEALSAQLEAKKE